MNTEQIYKAWRAVGADIAGLKWDDFVKALEKQPAQQEPVVSKATYNRIRDDYNELLTASKRDAADAKSWRNHVVRCQFGQVDLDHVFTSPQPVPVLSAGPITPAMMKPFTQEERNELEQVLKTHMKPASPAQWLGEALFECIKASGIIRKDITGLSVTELLFFSQDLKRMLAADQQSAQQEPVGYQQLFDAIAAAAKPPYEGAIGISVSAFEKTIGSKLYTSPPAQRKPLTDEEIRDIADKKFSVYYHTSKSYNFYWNDLLRFVRAIEAAHGIKEKNFANLP